MRLNAQEWVWCSIVKGEQMSPVQQTLSNIVLPTDPEPLGGWDLFCKGNLTKPRRAKVLFVFHSYR